MNPHALRIKREWSPPIFPCSFSLNSFRCAYFAFADTYSRTEGDLGDIEVDLKRKEGDEPVVRR